MRAAGAALVLTAGLLAAPPALAVPWSAADLREACADGDLYYLYGACTGYLAAVHDSGAEGVCLPAEATIFDLEPATDAVGELEAIEGEGGSALALRALAAAFPCE